jgi:hypothetical protein
VAFALERCREPDWPPRREQLQQRRSRIRTPVHSCRYEHLAVAGRVPAPRGERPRTTAGADSYWDVRQLVLIGESFAENPASVCEKVH